MSEFKFPPITTLAGSSISNYTKMIKYGRVEFSYYNKVILTGLVSLLATPFQLRDKFRKPAKAADEPPIFILGHWRSGTTFLHNLLCQDSNVGFVTTYQSLFPRNMHSKWIFKNFMRLNMPTKRPTDDVELNINFPQEDEFALSNINAPSFYNFFSFPDLYEQLFEETILFKDRSKKDKEKWLVSYKNLINRAVINTNGKYAVIKNPVNTGRIDTLLKMYPDAKFLHIYRNPVIVYLSTKKFFLHLFPMLQLQGSTPDQIVDLIFDLYKKLMTEYIGKRKLIPKNQLIEIDFESFEKDPLEYTKKIYKIFKLPNWDEASINFKSYLDGLNGYKKNKYRITQQELDRVLNEWDFAFKHFKYSIPDNLKIID